jgi:hypothetical protein
VRRGLAALLVLGLLVSACGGNGDADELADAIGQGIWEQSQADMDQGDMPFEFTESDADCFGEVFVDTVGYDTLVEAGVTVESLQDGSFDIEESSDLISEPETAEAILDGMDECIDLASSMAEIFSAEMGISEDSSLCLMEGLMSEDAFRASIVESMVGSGSGDPFEDDPEAVGAMFGLMGDCLSDEELAAVLGG